MSKSAQIVKILEVKKHPNADSLDLVKVLGWQCVAKLGEFKDGEKVIYIEIDTEVKERPEFEFLRNKNFRVRTIRLRGELSQGLVLPLSVLPVGEYNEGDDVSELVGASHYEKPIIITDMGQTRGSFPTHLISITDEDKIQNYPQVINEMLTQEVYVSIKMDGQSGTFIKDIDGKLRACSRRLEIKLDNGIAGKFSYLIEKYKLNNLPNGIIIQAEIYGPGIQGNKSGTKELGIQVFNVWSMAERRYFDYDEMKEFCDKLNIPMVQLYYLGIFKWNTVEEMLAEAEKVKYPNGADGEGLVWRLRKNKYSPILKHNFSVKTVSNKYLIKHGE